MQYNEWLYDFRRELDTMKDDQAGAEANAFARAVHSLQDVAADTAVDTMLKKVDGILKGQEDTSGGTGLADGPMACKIESLRSLWTAKAIDGKTVEYTFRPQSLVLRFSRIDPPDGKSSPFYLCTTEVSEELFAGVVGAAQTGKQMMIDRIMPSNGKFSGPSAWDWNDDAIALQSRWWPKEESDPGFLPSGAPKHEPPAKEDPMQWIPPAGAMYFARLVGCRLPTAEEWKLAYQGERGVSPDQWNLRDQTWAIDQKYQADRDHKGFQPFYRDMGIFWPIGRPDTHDKTGDKAIDSSLPSDDHTLWFRPVQSAGGNVYKGLVGNVAEYVFNDPAAADAALAAADDPKAVDAFVKANIGKMAVIGGSALSPPGLDIATPYPVPPPEIPPWVGYSDVGLRLAFTAQKQTKRMQLQDLLKKQPYQAGAGASAARAGDGQSTVSSVRRRRTASSSPAPDRPTRIRGGTPLPRRCRWRPARRSTECRRPKPSEPAKRNWSGWWSASSSHSGELRPQPRRRRVLEGSCDACTSLRSQRRQPQVGPALGPAQALLRQGLPWEPTLQIRRIRICATNFRRIQ